MTDKKRTFWFKYRTFWFNVVTFWRGHAAFFGHFGMTGRRLGCQHGRTGPEEGDGPFPTYRSLALPQSEPPRL